MNRRLQLLLSMSESARRQSRLALAGALAEQAASASHAQRVTSLIAGTASTPGPSAPPGLSSAASLRALLAPAETTAGQRLNSAVAAVRAAETALKSAEARHQRLLQAQTEARRQQARTVELKSADDRPFLRGISR